MHHLPLRFAFMAQFLRGLVCTHAVLMVFDTSGLVNPQFSITAVWASAPQVIGLIPPSKEFATPVYNQVHQQQIGAKETTQNKVEIPTVQVIALEIPDVQIVERIESMLGHFTNVLEKLRDDL